MPRDFRSIGDVLDLLKADFPDVTISKIRFLESQGLIDPERTPSGYRKFYDADITRLRWILTQQKDHYLPLRVIKEKLEGAANGHLPDPGPRPPAPASGSAPGAPAGRAAKAPAPAAASPAPKAPARPEARRERARGSETTARAWTRDELATATGLTAAQVQELAKYGLIAEQRSGSTAYYPGGSEHVCRLAKRFLQHGVEARHLRMFQQSADRQAALLEQVVGPLLRQRNPEARRQAIDAVDDLAEAGQDLYGLLVDQAVRRLTGDG